MQTIVLENQSLLDIAIQLGGSLESVFELAVANDISITESTNPGQTIFLNNQSQSQIVDYYRSRGITPATSIIDSRQQGGIGYMAVGIDFIIS